MLSLLRLATRNVMRNRARSALTFGAIFFGVVMTIVLSGFANGINVVLMDDVINAKTGAIQVHRKGYAQVRDDQPLKLDVDEGGELEAKMRATPGVVAVAPRIVFAGLVNNGRDATMMVARGIDPEREYATLPWSKRDVDGEALGKSVNTANLGFDLAQAMGAKAGTTLSLQAATQTGQQNALDFDVAGTINNTNFFESKRFVYVPLAFAQQLLRMPKRATEYVVRVDDRDRIDDVAADLRGRLGADYEVDTWREVQPTVAQSIHVRGVVVRFIAFVLLIIVVFGVTNTMVMSVLERTREIGTMMALGVTRRKISTLFVFEAAVLALIGGALGYLVARGIIVAVDWRGGLAFAMPGSEVVRYHLHLVPAESMVTQALAGSIVGAILAALYPAWKAARLRPVEALRAN